MALTTTPATITAYDTVRADEEGLEADKDAGTFTFLSASRYRLNFSANLKHHSGGQTDTTIGLYINDVNLRSTLRFVSSELSAAPHHQSIDRRK